MRSVLFACTLVSACAAAPPPAPVVVLDPPAPPTRYGVDPPVPPDDRDVIVPRPLHVAELSAGSIADLQLAFKACWQRALRLRPQSGGKITVRVRPGARPTVVSTLGNPELENCLADAALRHVPSDVEVTIPLTLLPPS